jgi:hypothetical protein
VTTATARRTLTAALFVWGAYDLAHAGRGTLLDGIDLAIHETGHLVFNPFGEFIGFAGGTLFQLIMPAIFVGYFWRRDDRHAASVALWWVAQNCGNIATYAADARAQELPLVGGGEHDWFYLLSATRHLDDDLAIARVIRAVGVLILVGATVWGLVAAGRRAEQADSTSALAA